MRLLIDTLIALMLVGILAAVLIHHRREQQEIERYRQVHEALSQLYEQTLYHSVMDAGAGLTLQDPLGLNRRLHRFPTTIDTQWFDGVEPINVMAPLHPWVDVAPPGDTADHPPDPILRRPEQAGFWYNPTRGIFRARVPPQLTEERTLELYNRLNNCGLIVLHEAEEPGERAPRIPESMRRAIRERRIATNDAAVPAADPVAVKARPGSPRPALLRSATAAVETP